MKKGLLPALALLLAVTATAVATTERYEGESYRQDNPAWTDGSYLGQFHPWHQQRYINVFGRDAACAAWAGDQKNSAIRGLRAEGYMVEEPPSPDRSGGPNDGYELQGTLDLEAGKMWNVRLVVTGTYSGPLNPGHTRAPAGNIQIRFDGPNGERFFVWNGPVRGGRTWDLTYPLVIRPGGVEQDSDGRIHIPHGRWSWHLEARAFIEWEVFIERQEPE